MSRFEQDTEAQAPTALLEELLESDEALIAAATAADETERLEERLAAYDDVIDAEIGDTNLFRCRHLERSHGLRQLYVKLESSNPSGTQKDRIAFAQARDALRRGYDTITVATCGNYGVAMALAAAGAGLRCQVYLPERYHSPRVTEMLAHGVELRRVDGDYERAVEISSAAAAEQGLYDANPGGTNTDLQLEAYAAIAYEIYDELRDAPLVVAAPVSNGTTLAGIHRGFVRLYKRGKTSRVPRIVAGSTFRKNPIVEAALRGLDRCEDLDPQRIRETAVNEPLINWHSSEGQQTLDAIASSEGWAGYASDRAMKERARALRQQEGVSVLPASTAGLIALLDAHAARKLPADRYVAVLTGRA